MRDAKRLRARQESAPSATQVPAPKRLKTASGAHVPAQSGLGFLVDDDARAGRKLEAKLTNGVPRSKTVRPDESDVVVAQAAAEADEEDEEEEDGLANGASADDTDDEEVDETSTHLRGLRGSKAMTQSQDAVTGASDADMEDLNGAPGSEELSFGELLQSRHPGPIDVAASLSGPHADRKALVPSYEGNALAVPSGTSLGTVLTQALKTNDKDLLESCLQTSNIDDIHATIQRLPSQHVATLLESLAERMHRRPGRTGLLMVWVQWSLVAHGGYLVSQPGVMKKLQSLSRVIRERAKGLQPLLLLKGKLDMLNAQLELRKEMQQRSRAANADDDDDDENVVYIEGQDDVDSSDEARSAAAASTNGRRKARSQPSDRLSSEDEDDSDDLALPNGVATEDDEDDSNAEEDEEGENMFDLEAEETSDDDAEEADSDDADSEEDVSDPSDESEDDDESIESGVKEPKLQTLSRRR